MLKQLAQAVREIVLMGGRVSDETFEWLEKFLGDDIDEFQEWAKELSEEFEAAVAKRFVEINERIDKIVDANDLLDEDEEPKKPAAKPAQTAKKAEVKK